MREKISQNEWLIDQQRKSIESKDEQILALKKQVEDLSQKLEDKTIENQLTKNAYMEMSESKFWKMTLPLQNMMDKIRSFRHEKVIVDENVVVDKHLIEKGDHVLILSTESALFYCSNIQKQLEHFGAQCEILKEEPVEYLDALYFVVCNEQWEHLPKKYIAIQVEDVCTNTSFSQKYLDQLLGAIAVFDCSTMNIQYFKSHSSYGNRFYYVPADFQLLDQQDTDEEMIDVLCVGNENSPRCKAWIQEVSKYWNVCLVDPSLISDSEFVEKVRQSKIVLNLHAFDASILETSRLYEILSYGNAILISESSVDSYEEDRLKDIVTWVKPSNYTDAISKITYWLENDDVRKSHVHENYEFLRAKKNDFAYYFYRFLLAFDCISFDEFYECAGNYISFDGSRICLSLPEDVERRNAFLKDNQYGFELFAGLRHTRGWTGCGLSYKFIMKKAKEQGFSDILICEDDVLFPEDFEARFSNVMQYLDTHNDWDVFQGVIADVGNVEIQNVEECNEETIVYLNHMVSMVFNYYKSHMFDRVISWDETDANQLTNTIDRALESKDLKVVTTVPFLVGHKEDLKSTIWGFENTEYTDWIHRSSEKLQKLVNDFKEGEKHD